MTLMSICLLQREILRLESPVPSTIRVSSKHDVIPLAQPVKASNGRDHLESVTVAPGQVLIIGMHNVNKNKAVYGDDAGEYRPERWLEEKKLEGNAGVYSQMMSFLAGPRACIGYKMALLELKA